MKHLKQLLYSVFVILIVMMALLVTLLILGLIDRALFIQMSLKMTMVLIVLTAASALIIRVIGVDKKRKK